MSSALSAERCVKRLRELGFAVERRGPGMSLLKSHDRRVIVPDVTIGPEMLVAILRSAGVSEADFFGGPQRSGVYPRARLEDEEPT